MAAGGEGGGGGASPVGEGGRDEWLRIYDRMVAMLRKNQKQVEALAADRARLEAVIKIQHQFWVARDGLLQGCLHEVIACPSPSPSRVSLSWSLSLSPRRAGC